MKIAQDALRLQHDEFAFLAEDASRLGVELYGPVRRESFVGASGEQVSGLVWGEGPPDAVFLHGGGLNAHSWDSTILALHHPAWALDLPGHGDSDWRPAFDYSPDVIAETIATVVAMAGAPVALIGHSLGGLSAVALAAKYPALVSSLTVVDTSPGREPDRSGSRIREFIRGPASYASYDEIIGRAIEFGLGNSRESLFRGVLHNTRVRDDGRIVFKHHLGSPPEGGRLDYDAAALWPAVESLTIPVLLVRGTRGMITEKMGQEFATRAAHATVVAMDAGHNVQRDRALELAAQIRASLDRDPPVGP